VAVVVVAVVEKWGRGEREKFSPVQKFKFSRGHVGGVGTLFIVEVTEAVDTVPGAVLAIIGAVVATERSLIPTARAAVVGAAAAVVVVETMAVEVMVVAPALVTAAALEVMAMVEISGPRGVVVAAMTWIGAATAATPVLVVGTTDATLAGDAIAAAAAVVVVVMVATVVG
jgi:hypothetical protein